jgi:putative nucleotidyltransferase with HDIG domain
MLVNFLDHKDEYTKGHCQRVTKLAVAIGQALDFSDVDIQNLEFAALLHDIGKLAVPDDIINKEGKLTMQEYEIVKMHPAVGYEIIKDISFLDGSKKILLQHHERIDGRGYPIGLTDHQIDIGSKILSIADAYDAMTSSRPYRKDGLSQEQAIEQLELSTGGQFDKTIVDVFISLLMSGEAASSVI